MSTWGWIIDTVLMLLLSGTFVMAVRLDRALRIVRRDRTAFETLIASLSSATNAVKHGIQKMRDEADRSAEQIERRSADADRMATDLSFMIEQAERISGRLESALREGMSIPRRETAPAAEEPEARHEEPAARSPAAPQPKAHRAPPRARTVRAVLPPRAKAKVVSRGGK